MQLKHRDDLHRGGFAGLRETRMVMNPHVFGGHPEPGTWPGLGRLVYLADARFLPHGETHMHPHHEIDVISLMVEGRIAHEGSLEHGQELLPFDVQVQRAGGEGFQHNEVNPDNQENRMIQFWAVPETRGEPAAYRLYHVDAGERVRVYGGADGQSATFPARTVLEVARPLAQETIDQDTPCFAYIVSGGGQANDAPVREGHMLLDGSLRFVAQQDSLLILAHLLPPE